MRSYTRAHGIFFELLFIDIVNQVVVGLYILVLSLGTWTSACFAAFVYADIVTCDANTLLLLSSII